MSLIWADSDDNKLALLVAEKTRAERLEKDENLSVDDRAAAFRDRTAAEKKYLAEVESVEVKLQKKAESGDPRTHVLVVGVGRYDRKIENPLTTSVIGAWKFCEWMIKDFKHLDRPLGSIELALSPTKEIGDWEPSSAVCDRLGLRFGERLPVELATFNNVKGAFERLMRRGGTSKDNAVFFYFSGHGLWKSSPLLLPQDAVLPTSHTGANNLIDPQRTMTYMYGVRPSVQTFFIDACQSPSFNLTHNLSETVGKELFSCPNLDDNTPRDACTFFGSAPQQEAYGPKGDAPYFTQELLACLAKRAIFATPIRHGEGKRYYQVTTDTLRTALNAAGEMRAEQENLAIAFSHKPEIRAIDAAVLCQTETADELYVRIRCQPRKTMPFARLYYVKPGMKRVSRRQPRESDWCTILDPSEFLAGADFETTANLEPTSGPYTPFPPVHPVDIYIQGRGHT